MILYISLCNEKSKRAQRHKAANIIVSHFRINIIRWRLIDSEFDSLNPLFFFTLEAYCDPDESYRHGALPFYSEKDSFLSHDIVAGQSVYCNPLWFLTIQCVEHLRTCHAKSPLNTKAFIVLPDWPQFSAATTGLRLFSSSPY